MPHNVIFKRLKKMREGIKVSVSPITKSSFVWFAAYIKKSNDSESKLATWGLDSSILVCMQKYFYPTTRSRKVNGGKKKKNELEQTTKTRIIIHSNYNHSVGNCHNSFQLWSSNTLVKFSYQFTIFISPILSAYLQVGACV